MNINRHNYETFFLLYVDNELSASVRKAVELFVMDHADLKHELHMLLKTSLTAESVSFNAKNLLYKKETIPFDLQEKLLLHLDNELGKNEIAKIESGISSDSLLKQEWESLQKTKLNKSDKIIFRDKHLLYRHEKGRVIGFRLLRIAVAAAILFAGLFIGISLWNKNKPDENATANNKEIPASEKQKNSNNVSESNAYDSSQTTANDDLLTVQPNEVKNNPDEKAIKQPAAGDNNIVAAKEIGVIKDKIKTAIIPLENINNKKSNELNTPDVTDKNIAMVKINQAPGDPAMKGLTVEKISKPNAAIIDYNSIPSMPVSYASTAVLNEAEPVNNNKILYMNEEDIKRSKVGGLFRKIKRTIERNTNIITGNGVTIAGFEIALK